MNGDVVIAFGVCGWASNCMKSDNPHSGFYVADTTRTLDSKCCDPACNQGGIAIVEVRKCSCLKETERDRHTEETDIKKAT